MKLLKRLVWITVWLALPYGIFLIGRRFDPSFDLRGPYLAASPAIAFVLVLAPVFSLFNSGRPEAEVITDPKIAKQVSRFAELVGMPEPVAKRSYMQGHESSWLEGVNDRFVSLPRNLDTMSKDERAFAIARGIVSLRSQNVRPMQQMANWLQMDIPILFVMFFAGFNLWLILPGHALCAAWLVFQIFYLGQVREAKTDTAALRLFPTVPAARSFIESEALFGKRRRLAHLQKSAATLGIH